MTENGILKLNDGEKHFSFEVLPPLKGTGTDALFRTIEKLSEFGPSYINITTHHSDATASAAALAPSP